MNVYDILIKLKGFVTRVLVFIIQIWLAIFAIFFVQSIIESVTDGRSKNKTKIIRGKYKEWKQPEWKQPDFPAKQ